MLTLLLEAAFRSLLLAAVAWLGLKLLRMRNPYAQLAVWTTVLFVALSMPVLIKIAPSFQKFALPNVTSWLTEFVGISVAVPEEILTVYGSASRGITWFAAISGLYCLIAAVLLFRLTLGVALTWRLRRRAVQLCEEWTDSFDVRVSKEISAPVSFAATILIPADYTHWPSAQRHAVLAHEGSHVQRGDFYIQILAGFHRATFWFSPLAWWLYRRLMTLGEFASDADAIRASGDRLSYAEILADFATRARPVPTSVAMARPGTVNIRMEHILSATALPARLTWKSKTVIAASLLPLVMASVGAAAQGSQAVKPPLAVNQLSEASQDQSLPQGNFDRYGVPLKPRSMVATVPPRSNPQHPVTQPDYPQEAKAAHHQGGVIMLLTVDKTGNVTNAKIDHSSGYDELDQAALDESLKNWKLLPGTVGGKPTAMQYKFAVVFKITDDNPVNAITK